MKGYTLHLAIVIMLIGNTQSWILGQGVIRVESEGGYKSSGTISSALDTVSDSVRFRPKKYAAKYRWEKAVSLPLEIVFFPVELFLKGTMVTIGFVDDSQLIPRLQYLLMCDDGSCGVIPTYASLSGGGVKIFQKGWFVPESKLDLLLSAGPKRRQTYQLRFRYYGLFGKAISSDYLIRYKFLPDEKYFFSNIETNETNFAHEQFTGEATFGKKFGNRRKLNVIFGLNVNNILEGRGDTQSTSESFSKETLPGLGEQVKLSRFELVAQHDSKNKPGNPSKGIEAHATTGIYSQLGDDKFGFWKSSFDFKHFMNLFYDRVLMLRIAGEMTEPLSSRKGIPFYYLSELGRNGTIRGFERGRFRDRDMVLGSLEYRYPIWSQEVGFDALLFIDAGKVTPDIFNGNLMNDFSVTYGAGIRIWSLAGLVSKLEFGWSDDGLRIHFGLN